MKIYGNLALYLLLALLPMLAYAVPQSINYQGVYRESGVPVTGSRAMTFRITDSGGSVEYWTSGEIDVDVSMGVFRAGLQVPASVDWGSITPFLEVSVGTTTLLPRDPLTSTAYAFFASTAQALVPGSLKDSHVSPSAAIDPSKIAGTAMTLTQTETVSGAKTFNADLIMGSGQIIAAPGQSGITIATSVVINTSGSPGELRMMNSDIRLVSYGARILFADGTFADSGGATFSSTTATGLGNNINADILADADQNNSGVIRLQTGPSTRLMIRNDGKIGIGTDIPLSRLSVLGNVAIGDYAGDPGSAPAAAPPYGLIVSGNVGIGMPNPTTALDVNGTITALAFSGKATSAGAATNIAGGLANEIPYQTGAGATTFTGQPGANAVLFANSGAPVWMNAPTLTGTNFSGIPDTALSSNVDLLNTAKTLSAVKTFTAAPVITTITANGAFSISTAASVGAIQMPNLYVAASGNVGVGTAGADQKLTVAGNVSQTGVIISSGAGSNYFAGSVGIGTTTPTVALDVNGGVRVGNYVSASTPSPVGIAGTFIFNTTIGKPYVSNGTVWKPLDSDFDSDGITDAIDVDDNNAADATAAPSEVLAGRTFYSGGAARTGTMATQTLDPANDTVLAGYYAATTLSAVDADLAAGNIAVSTTIFGKAGAYIGNNLPDTGQTTCWDAAGAIITCPAPEAALAQDGSYNPAATQPSYTDNGDFTITDNRTGLMWKKCSEDQANDAGCTGTPPGTYTWANAITQCEGLTTPVYSDWRLPNVRELMSILYYGATSAPIINTTSFPNTGVSYYWSGTTYGPNTANALSVGFDLGLVSGSNKTTTSYVRCVRAGP